MSFCDPFAGAQLPTISFIVINYNYGRFLPQCVESIFSQTYPNIECIVVDDCSTDDSADVVSTLKRDHPKLQTIFKSSNAGQSAACLDGYHQSSGEYVVFVDADDYLFEAFAETHYFVHMSAPFAVGFTSSDMAQVVNKAVVLGTVFDASGKRDPKSFLEIALTESGRIPDGHALFARAQRECLKVKFVRPTTLDWVWAPTSGTMYRRDALALFVDCPGLADLRRSTDAFFNYAINAFTGSILIERTLSAYRIHGANRFTRTAALNNLLPFEPGTELASIATKLILAHVASHIDEFARRTSSIGILTQAMHTLARKAAQARAGGPIFRQLHALFLELLRFYWQIRLKLI
ncbi:MAG TPA: glycosyltransferase family A protein [Methylovirgula sp.]|nr:glycosyltransferase family A protein [Methylovirgula sp.]